MELPAAISAEESEVVRRPSNRAGEGKSGVQAAFNLPGIHSEPAFFAASQPANCTTLSADWAMPSR